MTRLQPFSATVLLAGILALSACATPVAYKPEVEAFQKATAQTSAFMEAKRASIRDIRSDLRTEELADKRPLLRLGTACGATVKQYQELSTFGARSSLTVTEPLRHVGNGRAVDDLPPLA